MITIDTGKKHFLTINSVVKIRTLVLNVLVSMCACDVVLQSALSQVVFFAVILLLPLSSVFYFLLSLSLSLSQPHCPCRVR